MCSLGNPHNIFMFLGHKTWLHIAGNTDSVFTKLSKMHNLITFN